jgi:hypothetical protein
MKGTPTSNLQKLSRRDALSFVRWQKTQKVVALISIVGVASPQENLSHRLQAVRIFISRNPLTHLHLKNSNLFR